MRGGLNSAGGMTAVVGLAAALMAAAAVGCGPASPPTVAEVGHAGIPERIYSPETPWVGLGTPGDPAGSVLGCADGVLDTLRADDFGVGGALNVPWRSTGDFGDPLWTVGPTLAIGQVRYAGYDQEFGHDLVGDGLSDLKLSDLERHGLEVAGNGVAGFAADDVRAWRPAGTIDTWLPGTLGGSEGHDRLATHGIVVSKDGRVR